MQAATLEDHDTDWSIDAQLAILRLSVTEQSFTADDLRKVIRPAPHPNHVGAAFLACKNAGLIEPLGYQTSNSKTRRRGALRTWRRVPEGIGS
jgi:hypothetical protein